MTNNNVYTPLTVPDKVLEIVEECFKDENNGDINARITAYNKLKKFLIETGDGSYTLKSDGTNDASETMHTYHGGLNESLEKYVKPSHLTGKKDVHIMDICSGLGYTTAVCLDYLNDETKNSIKNPNICIEMVEISPLTLGAGLIIPSPLKSHKIVKKAIEDKLYAIGFLKYKQITGNIPKNITLNIHLIDAREIVTKNVIGEPSQSDIINSTKMSDDHFKNKKYDAILLVPFSPQVSPELYTINFLKGLKALLQNDGMLLTYTSSAAVRYSLIKIGLHIGEGPSFGRSGGTLASPSQDNIETPLSSNDERMIALSDAGIPFRDTDLNNTRHEISERRKNERLNARKGYKFASTVKSPIYLCKDIEAGRLRRRVAKNLKKLGFEDLVCEKAKYVVCPQFKECICGSACETLESSSARVIEMEKRLNEIINHRV
jgi:tRNA U34 5-methylaminomethyl-2-thiouridine-forming methyltransferase MnmC